MNFLNLIASFPFLWAQGMYRNLGTVNNFFVARAVTKHVKESWWKN